MYNYIKGTIVEKQNGTLTVEAGGIGYDVIATVDCYNSVEVGEITAIRTFLSIKEDSHTLYGFATAAERNLFLQLLTVSGVGTKSAILMLSLGSDALSNSIAAGDTSAISSVKGVSRKTAEKVIIELRDKIAVGFGAIASIKPAPASTLKSAAENDAFMGLINLGMTKNSALDLIKSIDIAGMTAEQIILAALKKSR